MKTNNNKSALNNRRIFLTFLISLVLLIVVFVLSVAVGAEKINLWQMFSGADGERLKFQKVILFKLRFPRSLLVLLTGILLGGSGAVFQLYFRNSLAEPGIMGISSGATLGAVIATNFGLTGFGFLAKFSGFISPVNIFAFAGAILAGLLVTLLAIGKGRENSSVMILLCGTALGTLYSSVSSMLLLLGNKELRGIYSWILGSFNGRGWNELEFILIPSIISIVLMFVLAGPLDLLSGGEGSAESLGMNVSRVRILVLICGALAVSGAVCAGGTIGFVGLIAPHIVRKIGSPKGKVLIPGSMIFGGILLLLADTLARIVMMPGELPAGIITSILGVPFFISLILVERK